jgi:hypothetical protein
MGSEDGYPKAECNQKYGGDEEATRKCSIMSSGRVRRGTLSDCLLCDVYFVALPRFDWTSKILRSLETSGMHNMQVAQ